MQQFVLPYPIIFHGNRLDLGRLTKQQYILLSYYYSKHLDAVVSAVRQKYTNLQNVTIFPEVYQHLHSPRKVGELMGISRQQAGTLHSKLLWAGLVEVTKVADYGTVAIPTFTIVRQIVNGKRKDEILSDVVLTPENYEVTYGEGRYSVPSSLTGVAMPLQLLESSMSVNDKLLIAYVDGWNRKLSPLIYHPHVMRRYLRIDEKTCSNYMRGAVERGIIRLVRDRKTCVLLPSEEYKYELGNDEDIEDHLQL